MSPKKWGDDTTRNLETLLGTVRSSLMKSKFIIMRTKLSLFRKYKEGKKKHNATPIFKHSQSVGRGGQKDLKLILFDGFLDPVAETSPRHRRVERLFGLVEPSSGPFHLVVRHPAFILDVGFNHPTPAALDKPLKQLPLAEARDGSIQELSWND